MSAFKDFPGLENLEKKFKDFQGPARAMQYSHLLCKDNLTATESERLNYIVKN